MRGVLCRGTCRLGCGENSVTMGRVIMRVLSWRWVLDWVI